MKVALITMFNGLSSSYSLVNIVREQLIMLLNHNISVKMLVSEHCPDNERTGIFKDPRIEWVKITNSENGEPFHWEEYADEKATVPEKFYRHSEQIASEFEKALTDVDVCLLHDILYQNLHLMHNVAIRKVQEKLTHIRFLSFTHSAPVPHKELAPPYNNLYTPMPNTLYCYPTTSGLPGLAQQYGIPESLCRCISNSLDPLQGMTEETHAINKAFPLTQSDILIVYPGRLSMAKGFHLLSEFAGVIKQVSQKSVKLILCDFPAGDICPCIYKPIIRDVGCTAGLSEQDIFFTSENGFPLGVQRETIYDLFTLSNLFICPSFSESFGLTVVEAAARGNFIVVNDAVMALHELGSSLNAYPMEWAARNVDKVTFAKYDLPEKEYFQTHAKIILEKMQQNPVLHAKTMARTRYSTEWVYENQLKPLLFDK